MAARAEHVVHPDEVEPRREGGAEVRTTFGPHNGCLELEQRILRIPRGRSPERTLEGRQEILCVVAGRGAIEVDGERHELAPNTGVLLRAGDRFSFQADDELTFVSVLTDAVEAVDGGPVTVRFEDQPELEASPERTYRYLVRATNATQFLGIIQPSKVPFHGHPYDEVGYIVEGEGVAHVGGQEFPLKAGSCFHLRPGEPHSIENSGTSPMQVLAVFHPAGSPADRSYA